MCLYKYCVCDLDGTLLNSDHEITEENKKAIATLIKNNFKVVFATGRVDLMVRRYFKEIKVNMPVISCNGALIRNLHTNKILYSKNINLEIAKKILNYCLENNIHFLVYTPNSIFYSENNPRIDMLTSLKKDAGKEIEFYLKPSDDIHNHIEEIDVLKILMISDDSTIINNAFLEFKDNKDLTVVSSSKGLLDLMSSNINKGEALEILSKKMDIDLKKAIAFGDNYNDINMFEKVGFPIAVGNAEEPVKKKAKFVTLSNNESGVAYAIYEKILK
ncbi:Cof-type HAD-IIB family hydrolase [Haloimpatiens sp. FM7315]|uniref:Cof-type HAD-IIB family hydrolase n=1 Tax=Haloimpatiens sp. FM7315 TaxID=3298609 RepID=UPI0035A2A834